MAIRLSRQPKHKPKLHSPARDETAMPLAEEYIGKISRERAIEMLDDSIGHIWRVSPDSWADSSIPVLTELCLLRALNSIRPNIREVKLPPRYPDQPGNSWRRFLYTESLGEAAEVVNEILETAGAECGEEFQKNRQIWIVNRLRRRGTTRLAKSDKNVNLAMIDILRKTSGRCTRCPIQLKNLATEGNDPFRWAQKTRVQLNRFCDRVYRVWRESDNPPLEKIQFFPTVHAVFRAECSLTFPKDSCVAQEAIDRAEKPNHNRKPNKPPNKHSRQR